MTNYFKKKIQQSLRMKDFIILYKQTKFIIETFQLSKILFFARIFNILFQILYFKSKNVIVYTSHL